VRLKCVKWHGTSGEAVTLPREYLGHRLMSPRSINKNILKKENIFLFQNLTIKYMNGDDFSAQHHLKNYNHHQGLVFVSSISRYIFDR
jgi:hypothetical protein